MSSKPNGRFSVYSNALKAISTRTNTPFPSLILSFGILHELTALVPLVGVFYGARTLGIGERLVTAVMKDDTSSASHNTGWIQGTLRDWVEEGDRWTARVGRRYGYFGYQKKAPGSTNDEEDDLLKPTGNMAGDVANAIVAYGATKALLPVRIGVSLYLSPMFSRRIVEPLRKSIIRRFRHDQ